jgi:hypothetical protein
MFITMYVLDKSIIFYTVNINCVRNSQILNRFIITNLKQFIRILERMQLKCSYLLKIYYERLLKFSEYHV